MRVFKTKNWPYLENGER